MMKASHQIIEEVEKKMKDGATVVVEGQKRTIDEIIPRKKLKQSYIYDISKSPKTLGVLKCPYLRS